MLCVISPAKRLDEKPRDLSDGVALTAPKFASDAWKLVQAARGLSVEDLRKLMGLSETLARLNRGRRPDLYHFRTQTGAELDIVEVHGAHCTAVEVKSSATVVGEDFSKIERALDVLAQTRPGLPAPTAVMVYGGEATWSIGRTRAVGWRQWAEELAAVGEG